MEVCDFTTLSPHAGFPDCFSGRHSYPGRQAGVTIIKWVCTTQYQPIASSTEKHDGSTVPMCHVTVPPGPAALAMAFCWPRGPGTGRRSEGPGPACQLERASLVLGRGAWEGAPRLGLTPGLGRGQGGER
eukprot:1031399-Rhodomonas_salina.1